MTKDQIKAVQREIGVDDDGIWGEISTTTCKAFLRKLHPTPHPWPLSSQSALRSFYGAPGDESNLVNLPSPAPLRYEGSLIRTIRCHRKVADSLSRAIVAAYAEAPAILSIYDGCFNNRSVRGGSTPSLHAYGAAIDFDAEHNGNHTHWPSGATMPFSVIKAFAREGWLSAGAFWSRDAMHFQATQ